MKDRAYDDALPAGFRLQEYRVERVLGQGGFGITYKAIDENLEKPVAIKEYLPFGIAQRAEDLAQVRSHPTASEDFRWGIERFLLEARTLGQFEHPNIVPVLRYFEANGTAYMVMAYQEGESLAAILDEAGTIEESEIEELLHPLLDGLERVHTVGVLHRDIKPENIFVRLSDGSPVLLDFGAARHAIGVRGGNVTRIVTPRYAPIEQYQAEGDLGPWTDLYALGSVVYRCVTGVTVPEALERLTSDTMTPAVEAGRGRYRESLLRAIDWSLAPLPDDRPRNIADWRSAFATTAPADDTLHASGRTMVVSGAGETGPGLPERVAAVLAPERRRPLRRIGAALRRAPAARVLAGGGAILTLLVIGVLMMRTAPDPPAEPVIAEPEVEFVEVLLAGTKRVSAPRRPAPRPRSEFATNAEIKQWFADRRTYVRLPGGSLLTLLKFYSAGRLTAARSTSDPVELGNESGRWWAEKNRLCLELEQWNNSRAACFDIRNANPGEGRGRTVEAIGSVGSWRGDLGPL